MRTSKLGRNWSRVLLPLLLLLFLLPLLFTRKQEASTSLVTITEFSDFQCPYGKRAASVVEQVRQFYGERVKVVCKQMPLPMHKQAFKAAQASVCAKEQGKFWEYHDRAFASSNLSLDELKEIALKVGLKQDEFNACINGRNVVGALRFQAIAQEIDQAMLKLGPDVKPSSLQDEAKNVDTIGDPKSATIQS